MEETHITVKVQAGAKKEVIRELAPTRFEIAVREHPERNEANKRVIHIIAKHFGVREKGVRIVKGHRSPAKMLAVSSH